MSIFNYSAQKMNGQEIYPFVVGRAKLAEEPTLSHDARD